MAGAAVTVPADEVSAVVVASVTVTVTVPLSPHPATRARAAARSATRMARFGMAVAYARVPEARHTTGRVWHPRAPTDDHAR